MLNFENDKRSNSACIKNYKIPQSSQTKNKKTKFQNKEFDQIWRSHNRNEVKCEAL